MSKKLRAYAIVMEDKLKALLDLLRPSITYVLIISLTSSCAWLSSRRTLFGSSNDEEEKAAESQVVSKEQYDALLAKYEALQNKMNGTNSPMSKMTGEDQMLMNQLNNAPATKPGISETVDVFANNQQQQQKVDPSTVAVTSASENFVNEITDSDYGKVEKEVFDLKKGEQLMASGQFNDAMTIFNVLRQSQYRQIRVRAQFNIGEILFAQNEFDLAMQAFEDIIQKQAFSGVVLKTLGRLIACASKLNLKEKQDQYYSILHDFFESA